MNDADLLKRIEEQAVRIAQLEEQLASARDRLDRLPSELRNSLLESMADSAVNCGPYSGCALARMMKGDE